MARQVRRRFIHPSPLALGVAAFFVTLACAGLASAADTTPPALAVYAPADGARLIDDRPIVFGAAERGAFVTVNGVPAAVNPFDGTFEVRDLTLVPVGSACTQAAAVVVVARDDAGNSATVVRSVNANFCGTHPRIVQDLPAISIALGQRTPIAIDLTQYFSDDGGADALIFSTYLAPAEGSATYNDGALSFAWSPSAAPGPYLLSVTAHDRSGEVSAPATAQVTVVAAPTLNRAPELALVGTPSMLPVGGAVDIALRFSDPEGGAVTLSAESAGPGTTVAEVRATADGTGVVVVRADSRALAAGGAWVRISAVDAGLASATREVRLSVYDPAVSPGLALASPSVPEVRVSALSGSPAGVFAEFTAARSVPYLLVGSPQSLEPLESVAALNDEQTYWRVFVPLGAAPGLYTQTLWVLDPGLPATPYTFTWSVVPDPAAPSLVSIASPDGVRTMTEGDAVVLHGLGFFPDGADTAFTWTVDGEVASHAPEFGLSGLPAGTHTITLTASGPGGSSSSSTTISVSPRSSSLAPRPGGSPWLLWLGIGGIVVVGIFLGGTEVGIYFLLAGLVGAAIDRQNREKLLTHFIRGRIYQIIEYEPGIHLSELQRQAGVARGVCAYHLHALEKAGLIKTTREGMYLRFFATKVKLDAEAYTLAADDKAVLEAIEAKPGITEVQVAELLGRSSGQVARSVKTLAQSGYVEARREGESTGLFARTQRGDAASP